MSDHRPGPRIGSLCTGYGGLDMAVELVLGGRLAWYAEVDRHARTVLAHHWPGVPNLGDIRTVDWTRVPAVDVLTAGFPCQDISNAGKRAGITGPQSSLWTHITQAIRCLRPPVVFVENVAALRRRGLDVVHADLAALGYDASWLCLRASDIGAAHRRDRLFLPPEAGERLRTLPTPCARDGKGPGHQHGLPDVIEPHGTRHNLLPTPRASDTGTSGRRAGTGFRPPLSQVLLPTPRATDGQKGCPGQRGSHGDLTLPSAAVRCVPHRLPTPRASDAHGPGRHGDGGADLRTTVAQLNSGSLGTLDETTWGIYARAIASWEMLIGRPVPAPTQPGQHGKPVLAPPFVEWLMGLPEHWVTNPTLGLPRTAALRVLGNGVVPAQAATALRLLLRRHH